MQQVQRGRPRQHFNGPNNNNHNFGQNRQNFRPNNNVTNIQNANGIKTKSSRDAVIQRNLQHMQQVAEKKRVAQERYYNKSIARSPMVKTASGSFKPESSNNRFSVQNRLGNRNSNNTNNNRPNKILNNNPNRNPNNPNRNPNNLNRNPNNPNRNPKTIFIRRNNNVQPQGGLRSDKLIRVQNFQQKRIRQNPNGAGAIKTVNQAGKIVYLTPIGKGKPSNYTVRVDNDNRHHIAKDLNPKLQKEIMLIQNKSCRQNIMPVSAPLLQMDIAPSFDPIAMDRLPTVATAQTLHERFSMI